MNQLIAEHNQIFKHHYSDLRIASPPDLIASVSVEMGRPPEFLYAI